MSYVTFMKPANYYASATQIPDYVEQAIAGLSRHQLYNLADALIEGMRDRRWITGKSLGIIWNVDQWLHDQSVSTFKDLHKWIVMELI